MFKTGIHKLSKKKKIYEPPQNSRSRKGDVKQGLYGGPTNIRRHKRKWGCPDYLWCLGFVLHGYKACILHCNIACYIRCCISCCSLNTFFRKVDFFPSSGAVKEMFLLTGPSIIRWTLVCVKRKLMTTGDGFDTCKVKKL